MSLGASCSCVTRSDREELIEPAGSRSWDREPPTSEDRVAGPDCGSKDRGKNYLKVKNLWDNKKKDAGKERGVVRSLCSIIHPLTYFLFSVFSRRTKDRSGFSLFLHSFCFYFFFSPLLTLSLESFECRHNAFVHQRGFSTANSVR